MGEAAIATNSAEYETEVLIDPSGFREYDARWRYPEQINLRGANILGMALAALIHDMGVRPDIVTGHDYRSYSQSIKQALMVGLMAGGCRVYDVGLALSPMAYFAQFELDCPAVAMVTASHNENGWTGVKMGLERPLTFGPDLMQRLRKVVVKKSYEGKPGGRYHYFADMRKRYIDDLCQGRSFKRRLKIVVACGNGTASLFAPEALSRAGCDVIPLHCIPDFTFPHYNPNPEDLGMLHDLSEKVLEVSADAGFAFDGDGDRCGVVDNTGTEIFSDKVGVLLARSLMDVHNNKKFIVDVKSTGLYKTDPVLKSKGAMVDYWKTGHSYIKQRVKETGALAGFEKSGHFFFGLPAGRGYDDGILSALMICDMLDRQPDKSLADLRKSLPVTWSSPTMSPYCPDGRKYEIVANITKHYLDMKKHNQSIFGQGIASITTVNGVRIELADGTWGLVRASSNKPCLVVVVESPTSEVAMHAMFKELDQTLSRYEEIGDYDQKLKVA